ncbi:DAK2 domain-containing protein [Zhaonella formicivorans]|uniref:DAK2 domain-containing protein n=1 Tax=Zhaonella formicivorans TaxID=2528593 RepID=UPI0010EA3E93|nr:DAK2 domain-containing protein [Zhaonella formicivorans]
MQYKYLDALRLQKMFLAGSQNLAANKDIVDALNVFPVPDGDTGTNMSLTLLAAVREVERIQNLNIKSLSQAMATGALMGARGNSGVILSQLFRGFSQVLEGTEQVDSKALAAAAQSAVEVAYKAVIKPVEGTILTVAKAAAKGAKEAASAGGDCAKVISEALRFAQAALERTPQMLPALAQAGVVDAGGKGLCLIIEGALNGLLDENLASPDLAGDTLITLPGKIEKKAVFEAEVKELAFRYCTELIIKGNGLSQELIRRALEGWGDSLLVVGNDNITKIHIHTNNPGKVLEYAVSLGTLHDIKIDNMEEQHQEKLLHGDEIPLNAEEIKPSKAAGIVAVSVGQGLIDILKSLGADVVVSGGQTMNPSTEDLVAGIKEVNAKQVYVLPNNKNIILAAEQAAELLEDIEVVVIPSKTFPQGMAALLAFDPEGTKEDNQAKMNAALQNVRSGELTYAVRDSQYNGWEIRAGEFLGMSEGNLVAKGDSLIEVARELISEMAKEGGELLSLFYGSEVEPKEAEFLRAELAKDYPELEIEIHSGGQPLYYYIIALE